MLFLLVFEEREGWGGAVGQMLRQHESFRENVRFDLVATGPNLGLYHGATGHDATRPVTDLITLLGMT